MGMCTNCKDISGSNGSEKMRAMVLDLEKEKSNLFFDVWFGYSTLYNIVYIFIKTNAKGQGNKRYKMNIGFTPSSKK
jgi:hypothetical protein